MSFTTTLHEDRIAALDAYFAQCAEDGTQPIQPCSPEYGHCYESDDVVVLGNVNGPIAVWDRTTRELLPADAWRTTDDGDVDLLV
jgi:hypothetical protein